MVMSRGDCGDRDVGMMRLWEKGCGDDDEERTV